MSPPFSPDEQQARVLEHQEGALLVTGSAGTGKTAVLRERFVRLIEDGADPERVALVVASRRSRDETRGALLGRFRSSLPGLRVLTIHGLANHVVGARHAELDYSQPPTVLSAADHFALVQELLTDQDPAEWPVYGHLLGMRAFADEVRQFLLRAQESLLTPGEIVEKAEARGLAGWRELARFLGEYLDVMDDRNEVDFAALVSRAALVAGTGDQRLFDHLLVDDHQDTTLAAEALLERLRSPDLVVAGDPDAHVFSFRGTTSVPIRRFVERASAEHVRLERTHRAPEPPTIEAWCAPHTSEEHVAVAREVRRLHVEQGVPWSELAVLVRRQGAHLGSLLRALDDARVPRAVPERGLSLSAEPATFPYILALRWLAASADERNELVESVLTSDLVRLSPAAARGLMRTAQGSTGSVGQALEVVEGLSPAEADAVCTVRDVLADAERIADRSVNGSFRILWQRLPISAKLVAQADRSAEARRELASVVALAGAVAEAAEAGDASVEAFLGSLDSGEHGPGYSRWEHARPDAVQVLTAHGAAGLEFDTVVVAGAVEGNFPSLTRPEPMFDLAALERAWSRSERNRARLEDERRLFRMVIGRARDRVLLTASDPRSEDAELSVRSRFVDELGVGWSSAPQGPFDEPVSVPEATATWRRTLADHDATALSRLAALEGLVALGVDPGRWWFQRDWTDTGRPLHETLRLSYSKLSTLENCELQHVLSDELGLGKNAGYQAWVGKTVHTIIEECEKGLIEKSPQALTATLDARWRPSEFPSLAVSEAYRQLAKKQMLKNWFDNYGDRPALAIERYFEFEHDGATVVGFIDRIGHAVRDGTMITDFKTGNADRAPKPEDSLQLGIYFLGVQGSPDLEEYRPVRTVELAYLKGNWRDGGLERRVWMVNPKEEEEYQARVRETLSQLISRKKLLIETEVYRPDPGADCFWCEFKTLCPLYPEGAPLFDAGAPA
jgi:superfamily I DNA/RNA helicase